MNDDNAREIVKQLHEIDRSLSLLYVCILVIGICVMVTTFSQCGYKAPVTVHVDNMYEVPH